MQVRLLRIETHPCPIHPSFILKQVKLLLIANCSQILIIVQSKTARGGFAS